MVEPAEDFEWSSDSGSPEAEFDVAWAQELLQAVLLELETECRSHDKVTHWKVFRAWLLEPDVADAKVDMSTICSRYGVDSPDKAYNMIANLKGRFRKILRRRLRRHVDSDAEVDDEINHFIGIVSRSSPRY